MTPRPSAGTSSLTRVWRSWGTKRVRINQVYQEYISDKDHLHMNATVSSSLEAVATHPEK